MKTLLVSFLIAAVAYVVAAVLGYFLIMKVSSNTHDRSMEAGMTGAFVIGPIVAVIAFIVAYLSMRTN